MRRFAQSRGLFVCTVSCGKEVSSRAGEDSKGGGESLTAGPFRVLLLCSAVLTGLGSLYIVLNEDETSLLWEDFSLSRGESERMPKSYWGEGVVQPVKSTSSAPGDAGVRSASLPRVCRSTGLLDQPRGASRPVPVIEMRP